jgi:hypothetical protein
MGARDRIDNRRRQHHASHLAPNVAARLDTLGNHRIDAEVDDAPRLLGGAHGVERYRA